MFIRYWGKSNGRFWIPMELYETLALDLAKVTMGRTLVASLQNLQAPKKGGRP